MSTNSANENSSDEISVLKQMLDTPLKEVESLTRLLFERDVQRCEDEEAMVSELRHLRHENCILGTPPDTW